MPLLSTADVMQDRWSTIEIVGTQKTGKTYSLYSMMKHLDHSPQVNKTLDLFDLDGDGAEALLTALEKNGKMPWARRPEEGGRLRLWRYNTRGRHMKEGPAPTREMDPFIDFIRDLNTLVNMLDQQGEWKDPKLAPGCVVIDPCTSYCEMCWDYILQKRGKELGGSKEQGAITEDGKMMKYVEPTDWTALQEKTVDMVKSLKSLPCHRIVTFHEELIQEIVSGTISMEKGVPAIQPMKTGNIVNLPLLSGKLQSSIGKNFSIILYTRYQPSQTRSESYKWLTVPSEHERVKTVGARNKTDLPQWMVQDFCKLLD